MKLKIKKPAFDIRITLIMFAVVPMLLSAIILSIVSISESRSELKKSTHSSMLSIIESIGTAFDNTTDNGETTLVNFTTSPIVVECLKNPDDPELTAKAQAFTTDFFNSLEGWEGIYIADWNSKVITHPAPPVVGKVMREGDRLKELQDAMLASDGVYNVGIITSPASGQLIMSMYAPVFDEAGSPIGYVGAGTFVNSNAVKFADVSSLGLSSAYVYFVDSTGVMLFHPDESKIGSPVENEAVKGVVSKLAAGQEVKPECVAYKYKGKMKYASYYVGQDNAYIAVLTADEAEVMSNTKKVTIITIVLSLICVIIFAVLAVLLARTVSAPLKAVADATKKLGEGDVTVECKAKSGIEEIRSIIESFDDLKTALSSSMTNVKEAARVLSSAIVNVDGKTTDNVESISQINVAIDEVASTSQAVAENAQDMAEKAAELGREIETLFDNVIRLHDGTVVIRSANNDAAGCMNTVLEGSHVSVEAVNDIAQKIADTNSAVEKIDVAIQSIESIADQTNLLSLNASIEASRAGEAGRGFTIVAQEIRTLAESSAMSAKEIKQIVEEVVTLSNATVAISDKVHDMIAAQQREIEKAQEKFASLSQTVETSIEDINIIKQIAAHMDEIKVDFANATTDLGAISEELGAAAQEVAASCQTVSAACTDTQASTEEMRAINDTMSSAIDYFDLGEE